MDQIPAVYDGIAIVPLIIGLVALLVQTFPAIANYAGVLAVGLAVVIGTAVLLVTDPTSPLIRDILTSVVFGFSAVAVHYSFVRPLAKVGTVPNAPPSIPASNSVPFPQSSLVDGHALPIPTGPLLPPRGPSVA